MSKKTRKLTNKAGKLMKCDGQMLKKVIEAKGYKLYELSRMLRYCSDYLTSCCRQNQISDVAAKYLMDYKIFPQMYDLEGEIKVEEPKEVKIDKDDNLKKISEKTINRDSIYGTKRPEYAPDDVICAIPNPDKEVEFGTPYGIVRSEKNLRNYINQAIGPNSPNWGTNLIGVRDMLENACFNGMPYNLEDMRNDLLDFAANVDKYPEKWVDFVKRMSLQYEPDCRRSPFAPSAQEIKKVLNEKYGRPEKGVKGIDYGYGPAPKNPSYYAAGHDIAKGVFKLMQATINDLKHDPEFKELIKQTVKEAYEEL